MSEYKARKYDIVPIGRSSIDLYSNDIGAPFEEIKSFSAFLGGSSTNVAVGSSRLGMNVALITAVGDDKVGDFVLHHLEKEGVDVSHISRIYHARTSAVLLGIDPPDNFPLVYYRSNAADWYISVDQLSKLGLENTRSILISGTALARDPSRGTVIEAIAKANDTETIVALDLDFRIDQWESVEEYAILIQQVLPSVDIVIGTKEEVLAAKGVSEQDINVVNQQISAPKITGNEENAIAFIMNIGVQQLIIKRGKDGASAYLANQEIHQSGFKVEVLNVLGAGDAFSSGYLYGYLQGWRIDQCLKYGNACGAILVTKQGCSNFSPTLAEVEHFIKENGEV